MMEAPANLSEKLGTFTDRFSPRTVATYNNNDIMVAKLEGPFHWHKHDETDDFFLVLKGTLDIELRDRTVTLRAGEVFVVPQGVEHRPVARGEVHILLIEPTGTPNTGDKTTAAPRVSSLKNKRPRPRSRFLPIPAALARHFVWRQGQRPK
jgi:mannose-6-phosphate isomerase-like protein (cupin superfamily)